MVCTVWILVGTAGCGQFPERAFTENQLVLPKAAAGPLARVSAEVGAALPSGQSAFWLIEQSKEALDTRLAMFDVATESLDIQYFIWEPDPSSRLLLQRLINAADRGVKIRLLMDDITVSGRDEVYLALDSHPGIEVRLFNPWRFRSRLARVGEFFARFRTLNHRLHNKTIIADGHLGLIGGRNLGDRYFGLYEEFVQNDLDILFAGPILEPVRADFDRYWNAPVSYPIDTHIRTATQPDLARLSTELDIAVALSREQLSSFSLAPGDWTAWTEELLSSYAAGAGEYLYDLPRIDLSPPTQFNEQFRLLIERAREELIVSTAYFVPDEDLIATLSEMVARGIRVVVLTNSLQTNNHTAAHVAYKRWRRPVLQAGIELYELQPHAQILADYAVPPAQPRFLGLHSKAVIVDRRWAFVGTPNIDPRSLVLNTENGIVADSPQLAAELRSLISEATLPVNAWRVALDADNDLTWIGNPSVYRRQPADGFRQRVKEFFVNLLPIKNQT